MYQNKYCLACGAPHKEVDYQPGKTTCSYCGFTLLEKTPLDFIKTKTILKYLPKKKSARLITFCIWLIILGLPLFVGVSNIPDLQGNLKQLTSYPILLIFVLIFIFVFFTSIYYLSSFLKTRSFLRKYNYDLNKMKGEAHKRGSKKLQKKIEALELKHDLV